MRIRDRAKQRAYQKKWEAANKAKRRSWNKQARRDRYWLLSKWKEQPCEYCGGQFPPRVMEFHHVRGEKEFTISESSSRVIALRSVVREVAKCDLVCANCHRMAAE